YKWSNNSIAAALNDLPAGDYSVTVTDALGCESVVSLTLSNPTAISATVTSMSQPTTGQSNGSIYVDVQGGQGQYSYVWNLNGAFLVASEDLTGAPAGTYQLQITDAAGCVVMFEYLLTETVGIQDPTADVFAEVFPNPAKDKATLAVSFPQPQSLRLSLVDGAGRLLHTWTADHVTEQNIPLDLEDLPAGAYQLRIRAGKDLLVRKVTVLR
ncbi:MAG: T9SS type A sorting domain-containing protein, partial [Saprospiraceae bacterium]